ncbi:carbohydrate sulfotransferase 13-like [Dreissena polymorpha]|uniref:Carbohydrate sulfotransferase n=1 Tax=Dreissena polymorpha TaxID=45954 RepID=A0A9D4JB41_DREPO|nr:carbohydrate sulfotransferase 13-like [Dreissena polymorpha]KAH3806571.1 hypothetical protein DPMN_134894 [Dreissena polymorpha]
MRMLVLRLVKKVGTSTRCLVLLMAVVCMPFVYLALNNVHTSKRPVKVAVSDTLGGGSILKRYLTDAPAQHTAVGERFAQRRRHLQDQCADLPSYFGTQNSENAVKEHLTIDTKHNLVYCAIEKIGSTFWKRVYQILSGFKNVSDPFEIQGIRAYEGYLTAKGLPFDRIHYILKNSKKFMFVREPYERLLSGYVDKLFAPNAAYWAFIGTFITQTFRANATAEAKRCGHDVTFEEFVLYFIYSQHNNLRRDAHFVPNFEHCRPCEIDYEYIGKLETFKEDTLFLLKELQLDSEVRFTDFQTETERDAIVDAADYVYSMQKAITKCMSMHEALFRCYRKLQIRGIISTDVEYPFIREGDRDISIDEYKRNLLTAHAHSGPPESRKSNRREAFIEAYSTLSADVLLKLTNELSVDAKLFDYELVPKAFEKIENYKPEFSFFHIHL